MTTLARLAAIAALAFSALAMGQGYPAKPITIIAGAPPGGTTDVLARTMADVMGKAMGQTMIVDNKPGASGMLGVQQLIRAPADGYTVLVTVTTPIYYAPYTFSKLAYDVRRDLAFVTHLCSADLVLAVNKDVPAKDLKAFVAWAAQNKGKVSYASYGTGSAGHLISAYFSQKNQLDMLHIPYKGETPMLQDLIGGQVAWTLATVGSMLPHITSGRLRALAVLGPQRMADLPEVPTMVELGYTDPEFKIIGGLSLMASAGTPPTVLARLEKEARAAVQSVPMKARFQAYGLTAVGNSAEQARQGFEASGPVIEKLVKASGVKLD